MKYTIDVTVIENAQRHDSGIQFFVCQYEIGGVFYSGIKRWSGGSERHEMPECDSGWYAQSRDLETGKWNPCKGPYKTRDDARSALIAELGIKGETI